MIKIPHEKLNFCDPNSEQAKPAMRNIKKFNFIKHRTAVLLIDSSIIERSNFAVIDDNPYLLLRFLDRKTWRDTRILIGAYDVLQIEDGLGFTYTVDKEQTKIWRQIMLTQYPEYKDALIKVLDKRKFEAYQHYQDQIDELIK